ncbi:calcium-transporting ATPase [Verticillium alfalfae VaMs.102]|uniref:Calcium-transporting ATPase 2 n=1 Tax=Verticillium alfalfae (strain VaMs.102 / ATCC MYA-4576 / FGSC 10136) TaxID=526221 RepID=C9SLE1_VERA1|nr:calcium-transporting ATPase [Verticillium alfalfae VaMs.102]EEY19509.1 calcium-transporting ATPase [Verticillium alfalfae VaMs.102]
MDNSTSRPASHRRPQTPAITVDTSAINNEQDSLDSGIIARHLTPVKSLPSQAQVLHPLTACSEPFPDVEDHSPTSPAFEDTNTLAVPTRTSRAQSWDSNKSHPTQSPTTPGSDPGDSLRKPSAAGDSNITGTTKDGKIDPLSPDPGEEQLYNVANNPFAFSPGQLTKIINPKSLEAFVALGGLPGLEKGLRTDRAAGLSLDEATISDPISFEDAVAAGTDTANPKKAALDVNAIAKEAGSQPDGLAGNDSDGNFGDRKRVFGENLLPERKSKSFLELAWIALQDKVLILLSVAAVISLALGLYQTFGNKHHQGAKVEWVEGVAIVVAILIVVIVGAANDWQKERQFRKLNKKKEDRIVKVIRSGKPTNLSIHRVLVGDVMLLEAGDVIPVDGVYIDGHNVSCDESFATGESDLIKKVPAAAVMQGIREGNTNIKKLDPFLISGARILDGVGTFLVTAVGQNSSHGRTMMSLRDDPGQTPLQLKLNILAGYIAKLGSAAGLILLGVLTIQFLARLPGNDDSPDEKGQTFLQILITSITIVVVAVPEGLPLAVTLSLAYATKRMTKENNLVRHLQSCETMGNATVICSDKTGTLTENVMTVVAGSLGSGSVRFNDRDDQDAEATTEPTTPAKEVEDDARTSNGTPSTLRLPLAKLSSSLSDEYRKLLKESVAVNTTAFEAEEKGKQVFVGTKTETALLDWARKCFALGPIAEERSSFPTQQLLPFNSKRKCMGIVIRLPENKYRLFIKGAPEIVLGQSNKVIADPTSSLARANMEDQQREDIKRTISDYAKQSLRTLALAYRDFESWPPPNSRKEEGTDNVEFNDLFKHLNWIGVVGIQDPVRGNVPKAVAHCHSASVSVKMVTGDNIETAKAIARDCGILTEGGRVMEGLEFRRLSDQDRRAVVRDLQVLARSSPEDKRILVKTLKSLGDVVAVTGDGTNDAPALKAADVGFSMGITGTEVAKEASDIILMDDNFSSIVGALAWGRAINDAVKKFLQFQITVNITAVILTFVSAVASAEEEAVLKAIQLLWVNLIMDSFGALALATDPPTESQLRRKPEPKTAPLITLTMWKMIIGQSIYQLIGLSRNRLFLVMFAIMVGGQVLIVFVGSDAFVVVPLTGPQWGISLVLGFLSIPIGVLIRLFPDSIVRTCAHWVDRHMPRIPMPKFLKRKKNKSDEETQNGVGTAFQGIRDDLLFLKRIRGGRIYLVGDAIVHPVEAVRRTRSRSRTGGSNSEDERSSMSPMRSAMGSAVGMPGIIAASIGGLSPIERQPSTSSGMNDSTPLQEEKGRRDSDEKWTGPAQPQPVDKA